ALGLGEELRHLVAVVFVEAVALDDGGADVLAVEDVLEGRLDGRRAGAAGAGDGAHGVLGGQRVPPSALLRRGPGPSARMGTGRRRRRGTTRRRARARGARARP